MSYKLALQVLAILTEQIVLIRDILDYFIPGLPDGNKKLSPNSLQKIAKLNKNSPNILKLLHLCQNINFVTGNQSFKALSSFALNFSRKRIGFQHFANICKLSVSTFCKHIWQEVFNTMLLLSKLSHFHSMS